MKRATPASRGERRFLTVVHASLSGWTWFSGRLGPEESTRALAAFISAARAAVETLEGEADAFLGDTLQCVFGSASIHEDDTERGLHAALALQRIASSIPAPPGTGVRLAVGVDVGPAEILALNNGRAAWVGAAVENARRLREQAGEGRIFVSERVLRLCEDRFSFLPRGEIILHDSASASPLYELRGERVKDQEAPRSHPAVEMTGRNAEMERILAAAKAALEGRPRVLLITGDAGLGKTRLLGQAAAALETAGFQVCQTAPRGRSFSRDYELAAQFLDGVLRRRAGENARAAAREKCLRDLGSSGGELNLLLDLLSIRALPAAEAIEDARARKVALFAAVRALVEAASGEQPLAVLADDLHLADALSRELLLALGGAEQGKLLVAAAARPGEASEAWKPSAAVETLTLRPLSAAETQELFHRLCPLDDPAVARALSRKADGNPRFVTEIVKSLWWSGALRLTGGKPVLVRGLDDLDIPDTLTALLIARIGGLRANARELLQYAAVLGEDFTAPMLGALGATPEQLQALDDLAREGFVTPQGETWQMASELMREVVLNSLTRQRRRELHMLAARAWENLAGAAPEKRATHLAHHAVQGGEPGKAIPHLLYLAQIKKRNYDASGAVKLLGEALDFLSESMGALDDAETARLTLSGLLARGELFLTLGDANNASRDYQQAMDLARSAGGAPGEIRAADGLARVFVLREEYEVAAEHCRFALQQARELGRQSDIALCLHRQGLIEYRRGDFEPALLSFNEAISIREALDEKHGVAASANSRGNVYYHLGRYDDARASYEAALAMVESLGDLPGVSACLNNIANMLDLLERYEDAAQYHRQALEIRRRIDDRQGRASSLINLGGSLVRLGQHEEAGRCLEEGAGLARRLGINGYLAEARIHGGLLLGRRGNIREAIRELEQVEAFAVEHNLREQQTFALLTRGDVMAMADDHAAALDHYRECASMAGRFQLRIYAEKAARRIRAAESGGLK
ncbi:MAG: hypothetical protein GMKNLPBB_02524 [Myxococcota bacterium]|nr:hypothetical protein [Myxococcota bacterium]